MIAMYPLHTSRVFAKNTSVSRIFGEDFMIAKYRVAEVLAHCQSFRKCVREYFS